MFAAYEQATYVVEDANASLEVEMQNLGVRVSSSYMEALLAREAEQRDETGRPLWWTEPVPRDQQELPLTKSA